MINQINQLSSYQKQALAAQVEGYGEGRVSIVWDGYQHEIHSSESVYVGYKCECGALIADYDDYSGRYEEVDQCHKCGAAYNE